MTARGATILNYAASVFGAVGGPVAFLAGERIGAALLRTPLASTLLWLAAVWCVAMAGLAVLVRAVDAWAGEAGYRGAQAVSSPSSSAT